LAPLAILIGGVTDIVTTNLLVLPIAIYVMIANGILRLPMAQQQTVLNSALHANGSIHAATMVVGIGFSVLGGYVAAWIAKHDALLNGALSSFLCVGFGLFAIATGRTTEQLWLAILWLPLSPLLGATGGYLRSITRF
jgi:hypothetical protein